MVNVSVCISHISGTPILYTHKEENVSPDTTEVILEVLPIYFDKPVMLYKTDDADNNKLDIGVNVTGTGHGRGGEWTNAKGRAKGYFNLQNVSQNCIISEIYFDDELP